MKTLRILAISVLVPLVAMSVESCSKSPASSITAVLDDCVNVSHKAGAYTDPAAQADYVARAFQAMDVTSCPADFRVAFQDHVNAWQQAASAFAGNTAGNAFLEGVAAGVTQNPGYIGQASQQAEMAGQQVNDTYYTLTQIAAKYGARVPRSVAGE